MSIGLHDIDIATYTHVPFNLEIMKMATYFKRKKEIVHLSSSLNPDKYGEFYIRKDFDDGIFPKQIYTAKNLIYGGYAFSDNYVPMDLSIEKQKADVSIYFKYKDIFSINKKYSEIFRVLTNAQHIRLSLDDKTIWTDFEKQFNIYPTLCSLIFHDKNIHKIEGAQEVIQSLVDRMNPRAGGKHIGFKFPIIVNNEQELLSWSYFRPLRDLFFIEYSGVIDDTAFVEFIHRQKHTSICAQMNYIVTRESSSENDFVINKLPQIFKQVVFCRVNGVKISLKYEDDFFVDKRWEKVIKLINSFANVPAYYKGKPCDQTVYLLVKRYFTRDEKDEYLFKQTGYLFKEEARELFQFVRENNYELFKLFYECESVSLKGGKLENDWQRN